MCKKYFLNGRQGEFNLSAKQCLQNGKHKTNVHHNNSSILRTFQQNHLSICSRQKVNCYCI
jgi:hypothetical protein